MKGLLISILGFVMPSVGLADVMMSYSVTSDKGVSQMSSYLKKDRVRMDFEGDAARGKMSMIWNIKTGSRLMIDHTKKTVMEINPNDPKLKDQQAKMDAMMAKAKAQMAKMPEAQRKMMEKMMSGKGGLPGMPAQPQTLIYEWKKMGSGGKVSSWNTDRYSISVNGKTDREAWVTTDIKMNPEDFQALKDMAEETNRSAQKAMGGMVQMPKTETRGYPAGAIVVKSKSVGKDNTLTLEKLEQKNLSDSMFSAPSGYKKMDPMSMGRK